MERFLEIIMKYNIIYIACSIVICILLYNIIKFALDKLIKAKPGSSLYKKRATYIKLVKSIVKYAFLLIDLVLILHLLGINVSSLLAGIGIVSVIAGLALQDALKDIIMGFNLVFDNYFNVDDVITINGITGRVLSLGLKCVRIQDIYNNNIYVISNRSISEALTISNQFDIDIPLPYEKNIDIIEKVIDKIINELKSLKNLDDIKYLGIEKFDDSAIKYKLRIFSNPVKRDQLRRDVQNTIKRVLDDNKISIPYTQIDIHNIK